VLKNIPGLNVVQQGGRAAETSCSCVHQFQSTPSAVDGIDVSDPSNANAAFDFGQLLTQDIERVECCAALKAGYGLRMPSAE